MVNAKAFQSPILIVKPSIGLLGQSTQYETNTPSNAINLVIPRKPIVRCKTKVFHYRTIWQYLQQRNMAQYAHQPAQ
jgi:hypothetical protein